MVYLTNRKCPDGKEKYKKYLLSDAGNLIRLASQLNIAQVTSYLPPQPQQCTAHFPASHKGGHCQFVSLEKIILKRIPKN